jgi:acyl carrier protein
MSRVPEFGDRERGRPMAALEDELKHLIVDALTLEDVSAAEIDSSAPLFVTGLGLDSIDALELAMAIEKRYGVRFAADDAQNARIFASVRSLAEHIERTLGSAAGASMTEPAS